MNENHEKGVLRELIYEKFPKEIVLSKKRRAKYYTSTDKIPRRYLSKDAKGYWKSGILCSTETGKPIVKNYKSVGKERKLKISGNSLWSGNTARFARNAIAKYLKNYFYDNGIKDLQPLTDEDYPVGISIDIYDVPGRFDLDNLMIIYRKCITDTLCGNIEYNKDSTGKFKIDYSRHIRVIREDDVINVNSIPSRFIPVEDTETRKMVVTIFKTQ